ncbi:hypothetical protein HID58_051600 [Brassica napus]|uniref:Uncharacterized protein n=1 Tax=Brassica napus TaxID=3708 RepID=A0ABQ8A9J0_BRANA|nr:hypothetical protein HID58_051600 [Brassica napus]
MITHSTSKLSFSTSKLCFFLILPLLSFSEQSEPVFNPEDIKFKPDLEERRTDLDITPGSCKPVFSGRVDSEISSDFSKPGLEERTDSDTNTGLEERTDSGIDTGFFKPGFELRVVDSYNNMDLEERTDSGMNMGSFEPEFDLSSEPGLEFPKRIKMMIKLQKRNMNKELEVVLLTNSKVESIIFAVRERESGERRERKEEEKLLFVRKRWL